MQARVEVRGATGRRELALSDFIAGNRRTALKPGELVTAILVPRPKASARSIFLKLGAREYLVISIAMVAVVLDMQRSEEHTSELQSLMRISYAVFCLKKKKNKTQ